MVPGARASGRYRGTHSGVDNMMNRKQMMLNGRMTGDCNPPGRSPVVTRYGRANVCPPLASDPHQHRVRWLLQCLLVVLCLLMGPVAGFSIETAEITVDNLNFRPAPDLNTIPLGKFRKGTRISVLEKQNKWLKVRYDGKTGYIRHNPGFVRIRSAEPDRIRQERAAIYRQIQAREAEVVTTTQQEVAVLNRLNEIDQMLNQSRRQLAAYRRELAELDLRIADAEATAADLRAKISAGEAYAARRLISLYKLHRIGRMAVLASAESLAEFFRRADTLERILSQDASTLTALRNNRASLEKLTARQKERRQSRLELETAMAEQVRTMADEKRKRTDILETIRSTKSLQLAAINALKQSARELDETLRQLSDKPSPPVPDETPPEVSFGDCKGLLKMPVKGKIINFSESHSAMLRRGIDIRAERGEPVHAVETGRILFSSWFKGYGNMIIIDHGENYYTVYAQLEELFKLKGTAVESGEVIATVGDIGAVKGPALYFEVRHHGKPLDPLDWLRNAN